MKISLAQCVLPALSLLLAAGAVSRSAEKAEPRLAHMVFFTLKDRTPEAREKFIASSKPLLSGHEGTVSFSMGAIAEDVVEPVSDRDFDVALHLVFESKAAEAKYIKDPRHVQFVEKHKALWSRVRVFDSYLLAH